MSDYRTRRRTKCVSVAIRSGWAATILALSLALQGAADKSAQFDLVEVAAGVFVHEGRIEPMSAGNLGDIANIGFIIGEDCVAVIDTGGSPQVGTALRRAMHARTDKPVCYVISTHAHPDHVLGNNAFAQGQATLIAHENFAQALGARMQTYVERFSQLYEQALSADVMVAPERTIADTAAVDLGNRVLKLTALGTGHTNTDLTVLDMQSGTLWTGDTLFVRHIPVLDGSISGWLAVMEQLAQVEAKRAVPGHGPASVPWPQALDAQRRYLENVAQGIRAVIDRGGTIQEAVDTVGYGARDRWLLFDEYHRRNVTAAFAELEWE